MPVYRSSADTTVTYKIDVTAPFFYAEGTDWRYPTIYALTKERHLIGRYNLRLV